MSLAQININVWFNQLWLNGLTNFLVTDVDANAGADIMLSSAALAAANYTKVSNQYTPTRVISVGFVITESSRIKLEQLLDTLRGYLQGTEKELIIAQSGAPRKYTVTTRKIDISKTKGGYTKGNIEFLCSDPFGYDTTLRTLLAQQSSNNETVRTYTMTSAPEGNAQLQPVIITVTMGTTTTQNHTYTNPETGQAITFLVGVSDNTGTVFTIDGYNKVIYRQKSGGAITTRGYTGAFPEFVPGSLGQLKTQVDGASPSNRSIKIEQYRRWL